MPDFNCECDDGFYDSETLADLRTSLLVRLGYAAQAENPPPGMALLLDDFLRRGQRFLYRRYDALQTERFFRWTMTPGERFYGLRSNIDSCGKKLTADRITWAGVEDLNGVWLPLTCGIPPEFYTAANYAGIPSHYEVRQCIEVFPEPSAAYTLRIKGRFGLLPFVDDDDIATIDSELVFLWALANAKNHYGQPDARDIAQEAQTYLRMLIADSHGTRRYIPGTIDIPALPQPVFLPLVP
jgi:hypothetical protein